MARGLACQASGLAHSAAGYGFFFFHRQLESSCFFFVSALPTIIIAGRHPAEPPKTPLGIAIA